ncbi:MAG: hypothetical protein L0271_06150 [Gemmatimonadetes bacterium]|nr:hypothetical protein [Gemmatimonadota bacterium]
MSSHRARLFAHRRHRMQPSHRFARASVLVAILGSLSGLSGCMFPVGTRVDDFPPAHRPAGIEIELALVQRANAGTIVAGELLELTDSAFLLLNTRGVMLVPQGLVNRYRSRIHERANKRVRFRPNDELRRVARFPYGLRPDLLRRLLDAHGQTDVIVVGAAQAGRHDRTSSTEPAADSMRVSTRSARIHPTHSQTHDGDANGGDHGQGSNHDPGPAGRAFLDTVRATVARFTNDPQSPAIPMDNSRPGSPSSDTGSAARSRGSVRAAAIAAGYRRLGPEFPAMGEHWVNPGLIVSGVVDPARPPVLCIADLDGVPTLISVAFTLPLAPGEPPPTAPVEGIWHDHTDAVDEESLLLFHPSTHAQPSAPGPRMAMFHAWTGLDNPDGPFAQNNWLLPFARLGLIADTTVTPAAGKALSVAASEPSYYPALFAAAAPLSHDEDAAVRRAVEDARARVASWLDRVRAAGQTVTPSDLHQLETVWTRFWAELERRLGPDAMEKLLPLR